ncbi:hypothetical protein [Mesorhizobium australicum]|uniref:hypothetical protein n=1 Tax=Mesorhizobium australicum TaxID=536018 RepID=UPI0033370DA3
MKQHNVPAPTSDRQMSLIFEPHRLEGMSKVERAKALLTLAQILMQATCLVVEELDDDQH